MERTEGLRKVLIAGLAAEGGERAELEAKYGKVWSTEEMKAEFAPLGFMAPFIHVARRSNGERGTLMFKSNPRYYFSFEAE